MGERTQADRKLDWETGRELERKDTEIERLRAALKPFAKFLDDYDKAYPNMGHSDDDIGWMSTFGRITFGDLRAARTALKAGERSDG